MKKRRISRIAISLLLTLSMLLSLPLYLSAADTTGEHIKCIGISPDQRYLLELRSIVTIHEDESMTYYGEHYLAVCDTQTGKVIRSTKSVPNHEMAFDGISTDAETFGCGVHWTNDSRFCAVDMPYDPEHGASVLLFDTKRMTSLALVRSSTVYDWIYEHDTTLDLPDSDTLNLDTPFMVEKWNGNSRLNLICEFKLGDGKRIWARRVIDTVQMRILNTEWGDALDFDDPNNPIWTKAEAIGVPAHCNMDFSVVSPDLARTVWVNAVPNVSDEATWGALYDSVTFWSDARGMQKFSFADIHYGSAPEDFRYPDVAVKWTPDSRYAVVETASGTQELIILDMVTGEIGVLYPFAYGPFPEEVLDAPSVMHMEAFSVFGEYSVVTEKTAPDGQVGWTRVIDTIDRTRQHQSWTETSIDGTHEPNYDIPDAVSTVKDGFSGFLAVSKTHATGLDGLFRIGEQYKYIHMEAGADPYREYVSDAHYTEKKALYDRYTVVYSAGGCWVLDENEKTVYAGTGGVKKCGAFVLAYNIDGGIETPVTRMRLFDRAFSLVMDSILDTAAQEDGSVWVTYFAEVGGDFETHLAHIGADGTVSGFGAYDGDLSEFRQG